MVRSLADRTFQLSRVLAHVGAGRAVGEVGGGAEPDRERPGVAGLRLGETLS